LTPTTSITSSPTFSPRLNLLQSHHLSQVLLVLLLMNHLQINLQNLPSHPYPHLFSLNLLLQVLNLLIPQLIHRILLHHHPTLRQRKRLRGHQHLLGLPQFLQIRLIRHLPHLTVHLKLPVQQINPTSRHSSQLCRGNHQNLLVHQQQVILPNLHRFQANQRTRACHPVLPLCRMRHR
jgi:hypothetical protein